MNDNGATGVRSMSGQGVQPAVGKVSCKVSRTFRLFIQVPFYFSQYVICLVNYILKNHIIRLWQVSVIKQVAVIT